MYTISYFAFMHGNKKKYRMTSDHQSGIFYQALFLFCVQMTFIFCILGYEKFDSGYKNDTIVNLCLFFTVQILHWMCLPDARNGIYMMKYVLCCP